MTGATPRGASRRVAVAPAPVVAHRPALEPRLLAHLLELLGAGVAAVGGAPGQHLVDHLAVARGARELADRLAVPVEPEPFEAVEDRVDRGLGRALAVGVLDAQEERPAEAPGVEPVEQRRARAADVQESGRGGREAGDDGGHGRETRESVNGSRRLALADRGGGAKKSAARSCRRRPFGVSLQRKRRGGRDGLRLHVDPQRRDGRERARARRDRPSARPQAHRLQGRRRGRFHCCDASPPPFAKPALRSGWKSSPPRATTNCVRSRSGATSASTG